MNSLPFLVDAQLKIQKLRVAVQTRRTHLKKQGRDDPETDDLIQKLVDLEKSVDKKVAELIEDHPAYPWFSKVKGVGKKNIAKVIGLIDINKAPHVSSLWQFAGYGKEKDGSIQKRREGQKISYCKTLRTVCWLLGGDLIKARGKYYDYYLQEKAKHIERFKQQGCQIVPAAKLPRENGKKVEKDGYISEGHIHAMALRKMIKLFLQHLWLEWRKGEGLPISEPYVSAKLGHTHIIDPWEMVDDGENDD